MEASQFPPNGGHIPNGGPPNGGPPNGRPPPGQPYTGGSSLNDQSTPENEVSQFPPNGGPPPVQPYTGGSSLNDQNYRRDSYPQQQMMNGGQGYMYPPAAPMQSQSLRGGQLQQPQQHHQLQSQPPPPPPQQHQPFQQQVGQSLKQENQEGASAMLGRTPSGSGPTALLPLDKNDLGDSPSADAILHTSGIPKEPASHSMIELGRRYTLQVVQQPQRARMCGFGDKDRRPITPPPCVRLIIIDVATGVEVDTNDIEYGLFVLNVDLWSEDGLREVNLVRHDTASPAISSTVPTSYQQTAAGPEPVFTNPLPRVTGGTEIVRSPQYPYHAYNQSGTSQQQFNPYAQQHPPPSIPYNNQHQQYPPPSDPYSNQHQQHQHQQNHQPQHQQQQQPQYGQQPPQYGYSQPQQRRPSANDFGQRQNEPPNHHVYYHTGNSVHAVAANGPRPQDNLISPPHPMLSQFDSMYQGRMQPAPTPQGMYTRNLIGSLSASAFRLSDPNDKIGIWFVLQDLSVRTEGNFRLRFSFCNVGMPSKTPNGNPANQISIVNTGKAPILASCYSDVFTVYSAKKFPGVVESTPLSKCFATQGIKIPIRKDGAPKKGRGGADDDDD